MKGPKRVGASRPRISARKAAASSLFATGTIVWFSCTAIGPPLRPRQLSVVGHPVATSGWNLCAFARSDVESQEVVVQFSSDDDPVPTVCHEHHGRPGHLV